MKCVTVDKDKLDKALRIGYQMSNLMFNWKQSSTRFTEHERNMMEELQKDWDDLSRDLYI